MSIIVCRVEATELRACVSWEEPCDGIVQTPRFARSTPFEGTLRVNVLASAFTDIASDGSLRRIGKRSPYGGLLYTTRSRNRLSHLARPLALRFLHDRVTMPDRTVR